jgi:hypothetical protein
LLTKLRIRTKTASGIMAASDSCSVLEFYPS